MLRPLKCPIQSSKTSLAIWVFCASLLVCGQAWCKRNDDVIVMKNGDRITGEVKDVAEGVITFKASYMIQPTQIDWREVDRIESKDLFVVRVSDGEIYRGLIERRTAEDPNSDDFSVKSLREEVRVRSQEVVEVRPIEDSIRRQVYGMANVGLGSYSGNSSTQLSGSGSFGYDGERNRFAVWGESIFSSQEAVENTTRQELNGQYSRLLSRNWFGAAHVNLLESSQQNLKLRTTTGLGIGRYILRTNRNEVLWLAGGVYTREKYEATVPSSLDEATSLDRNNLEGLFTIRHSGFRFKVFRVDDSVVFYPSFSDRGRVRINANVNLMWEIVSKLVWNMRFYNNYDSRPPSGLSGRDTGVTTSIGWKFGPK